MINEVLPEGWERKLLGELTNVRSSNVDKKSYKNDTPVKLCNYTDVYYNNKINSAINFMQATAKEREIQRFTLELDDVIITKDSETPDDIAVPAYVSEKLDNVICGYHLTLLKPNKSIASGQYLSHLFQLSKTQHHFYILANGITRFGLTVESISCAPLIIPPLPEQKKIASILSSVDEVIEKTTAQVAKLKDLKTSLMQELLTHGIGHSEFKDSPVGRIPVEWEVLQTTQLIKKGFLLKLQDGNHGSQYPRSSAFVKKGIPYLAASNISKLGHIDFTSCPNLTPEHADSLRIRPATSGDVILTHNATVGRTAIIPENKKEIIVSTSTTYYRVNPSIILNYYLFYYFQSSPFTSQLQKIMGQTTRNQVPITAQRELHIILPPREEQKEIAKILTSVDQKITATTQKLSALNHTKKALMQDLLTGKKRVN